MKSITKQEKEDYLETMYLMKRKGNQIVKKDICKQLSVKMSNVNRVTEELIEEGYLRKDENRHLFLTAIGLNKGREYLEKHRCLTEFLRLVSGADAEIAEENACRIEHVLDDTVYLGIRMFMEKRHTFSYTMYGNDLNFLFPYGKRAMPSAIYIKGTAHPRRLAEEYYWFRKKIMADICEESYLYLIPESGHMKNQQLAYWFDGRWKEAERTDNGYKILSEALECNIRQDDKLKEGKVLITVFEGELENIIEEKVRVLTVSLI